MRGGVRRWLLRGHVLLEDKPGLGKTTLAKALASVVGGQFARVQCTPDLLPGDITGFSVFNQKSREFEFQPGPVFADMLLADETNRTTPRTQSALLEAMAERHLPADAHAGRHAQSLRLRPSRAGQRLAEPKVIVTFAALSLLLSTFAGLLWDRVFARATGPADAGRLAG